MARHASLAEQLEAIRQYVMAPETIEPVQSNWAEAPSLITYEREEISDMEVERRIRIRPSVNEIISGLEGVEFTNRAGRVVPASGDIERASNGAVVRLGKLRFSDGTQTERAHKLTVDGGVVVFDEVLPLGAMVGTREAQERALGGSGAEDDAESNRRLAEVFGVQHRAYRPGGRRKGGKSYTSKESAAMLADAVANTRDMPAITKCRPGIACGAARATDQFVGMSVNPSGSGESIAWGDIGRALADRDAWASAVALLKDEDRDAVEMAAGARSMRHVSSSLGFGSGGQSMRKIKSMMIAANDNLSRAYKKVS